jgi:hypothetical protein
MHIITPSNTYKEKKEAIVNNMRTSKTLVSLKLRSQFEAIF